MYVIYTYTRAVHKETDFFFKFIALELNRTCLLQSTPLHSWYTAPNVFVVSGTRPGTARKFRIEVSSISFTVWNQRPFSENFHFGNNKKSTGGQIWRAGRLGDNSRLMLRQKFMDADAAQILRQHDASSAFRSKSCGMNFYRCLLLRWTSRTVRRRFWRITASTFSTWSSSIDVEGRPDLGSSSMDVLPDLKRWYHSWHRVRLKQSSP